jgi:predicted phosphodiesterase
MGKPNPLIEKILSELLEQFPNAPALTLAKKAFRENPGVWPSVETCRTAIRTRLGVSGQRCRNLKTGSTVRFRRAPRQAGHNMWKQLLPPALTHFDEWKAVDFPGPLRALVLSDVHVPFHDRHAVAAAIDFGLQRRANFVLLNGDIFDFYSLSRWEKDPRKRNFVEEVQIGRKFLKSLRLAFPRARIIFKKGNHEERFESYLMLKAPDFFGIEEFTWEHVYGLDDFKIRCVGEKRPVRLGKLNVIHGHEYKFAIANPVNPARGFFLRCRNNVLGGHFHQTSEHATKTLEQKVLTAWSTGCLCNQYPDYSPINNWNLGFAFVEVDKQGAFQVENRKIIHGKVW